MAWSLTARTSDTGASSSAGPWTSAAFTPTADSLLVVAAGIEHDGNGGSRTGGETVTVTDSETLSWTYLFATSEVSGDWGGLYRIAVAKVGGSPVSMTVTIDQDDPEAGVVWFPGWQIFDITGHDTADAIGPGAGDIVEQANSSNATKSGGDSETHTHTLSSAPDSGNLVISTMHAQNDVSGTFTLPSGYSSLSNLSGTYIHSYVAYHETTTTAAQTSSDLGQTIWFVFGGGMELNPVSAGDATAEPAAHVVTTTESEGVATRSASSQVTGPTEDVLTTILQAVAYVPVTGAILTLND